MRESSLPKVKQSASGRAQRLELRSTRFQNPCPGALREGPPLSPGSLLCTTGTYCCEQEWKKQTWKMPPYNPWAPPPNPCPLPPRGPPQAQPYLQQPATDCAQEDHRVVAHAGHGHGGEARGSEHRRGLQGLQDGQGVLQVGGPAVQLFRLQLEERLMSDLGSGTFSSSLPTQPAVVSGLSNSAFKVLLRFCMPSAGLRPQHKQDPVSEPRSTPALGFSHRAVPRRWVRSGHAGAGQEESCEEGKKAQGGQPLPQLTYRHPRGVPPVPARSPQQSWGFLPPGPCSDPSKPLPNSQQFTRPRLRAPQTEAPLSFPNTHPFICPHYRWAN